MKILIVNNNTIHIQELKNILSVFEVAVVERENFVSQNTDGVDLVIFSGGSNIRAVKSHPEDYAQEIDFIKNTDKKVIGICLGCEIVAYAFGSLLDESVLHNGIVNIIYNNQEFSVYESHRFLIDKISDELQMIASSEHGPEIIKHKTKPIYGIQFHPEVSVNGTRGGEILMEIIKSSQ